MVQGVNIFLEDGAYHPSFLVCRVLNRPSKVNSCCPCAFNFTVDVKENLCDEVVNELIFALEGEIKRMLAEKNGSAFDLAETVEVISQLLSKSFVSSDMNALLEEIATQIPQTNKSNTATSIPPDSEKGTSNGEVKVDVDINQLLKKILTPLDVTTVDEERNVKNAHVKTSYIAASVSLQSEEEKAAWSTEEIISEDSRKNVASLQHTDLGVSILEDQLFHGAPLQTPTTDNHQTSMNAGNGKAPTQDVRYKHSSLETEVVTKNSKWEQTADELNESKILQQSVNGVGSLKEKQKRKNKSGRKVANEKKEEFVVGKPRGKKLNSSPQKALNQQVSHKTRSSELQSPTESVTRGSPGDLQSEGSSLYSSRHSSFSDHHQDVVVAEEKNSLDAEKKKAETLQNRRLKHAQLAEMRRLEVERKRMEKEEEKRRVQEEEERQEKMKQELEEEMRKRLEQQRERKRLQEEEKKRREQEEETQRLQELKEEERERRLLEAYKKKLQEMQRKKQEEEEQRAANMAEYQK
nr:PREDICTED: uncharacterized protein KIAA2012 homolog [Latimeria chalumnae]|eukprot:XP_014350654.1 PREDICTED: uncharacterized protein KIAA2012 homolog [Latimeria chalumnae]